MKKVFEYIVLIPFILVSVEEKIAGEVRAQRKFLYFDLEALPGSPKELRVVDDIVSSSRLECLETSGLLRLGWSETPCIRVTESNQGDGGVVVRWPLELGECSSNGCSN